MSTPTAIAAIVIRAAAALQLALLPVPAMVAPPRVQIAPKAADAVAAEADRLDRQGRFSDAAARFHDAHLLKPLPLYLYRAARAEWLAGQPKLAISSLERLIKMRRLPLWLKNQARLELGQLQTVTGVRPVDPPKPPPPIVRPPPAAVTKPVPVKPVPAAVAPPAAPAPTAPPTLAKSVVVDVPRPKLVITPAPPLAVPPLSAPPQAPSKTLGISALVIAGVATIAAVALGAHVTTLQQRLDTQRLGDTDVFDLTRITKPRAVSETNAIGHWWTGVIMTGILAGVGVVTGAAVLTDETPSERPQESP